MRTSAPLTVEQATAANLKTEATLGASTVNIGDVDVLTIAAGDNNIGNIDIVTMPAVVLAAGTANIGDVDVLTLPALVAGTANIGDVDIASIATSGGKTITYVSVNQLAAGTTVLATASVGNRHKIISSVLVLSILGTLKFTDDAGDLTGPMDIAANAGFVLGGSSYPYIETGATNRALNLVTTLGAARGVVAILTET